MRFFTDPPLSPQEKTLILLLAIMALVAGYLYGRLIYG
jgi:hypothetical protein